MYEHVHLAIKKIPLIEFLNSKKRKMKQTPILETKCIYLPYTFFIYFAHNDVIWRLRYSTNNRPALSTEEGGLDLATSRKASLQRLNCGRVILHPNLTGTLLCGTITSSPTTVDGKASRRALTISCDLLSISNRKLVSESRCYEWMRNIGNT